MTIIDTVFTDQQLRLLDQFVDETSSYEQLILSALASSATLAATARRPRTVADMPQRLIVREWVIAPGTGQAIEVRKGQVLRIEQIDGGQCGDLNIFSLRDRHEQMHVGRTRMHAGNSPSAGDLVWTKGPWERPIATILTNTSRTDTVFPSCSALLFSKYFGSRQHTNCQQIQTEAQREYGLAPHDVHDSLNLFMYVETDADGGRSIERNEAGPDDFIEFYALDDLLAVPNVCGDDFGKSSNYFLRPLRAVLMDATAADSEQAQVAVDTLAGDAVLEPFVDTEPFAPVRDPIYRPAFASVPVTTTTICVHLDDAETLQLKRVWNTDLYPEDPGAALRDVLMTWVAEQLGDW